MERARQTHHTSGLHAGCGVDRITKETITGHLATNDTGHDRPRVQTDTQLDVDDATVFRVLDLVYETQRNQTNILHVGLVDIRRSADAKVHLAHRFHL